MLANDQKTIWEHQLDVGTVLFCDLGCFRVYSVVLERHFDVDSQNSKVGYGVEKFKNS